MRLERAAIRAAADDLANTVTAHRRELHRHPELGFAEHHTASYVESVLDRLGVAHHRVVGTGVVAVIPGAGEGCVGVRADMDALPITEAAGRQGYRSQTEGVCHACGHDGHTAVALGLAELLAGAEELPGTVVLYFQPAEEGPGGAVPMVAAGVLDDPAPQAVLSLHAASQYPAGQVALKHGAATASDDTFTITVHGAPGHAAYPHNAIDPVPIAASVVTAVQQMVTRELDPLTPAVVTFGSIHGGTRQNVIPASVELLATARALDPDTRAHLMARVPELASGIAATHRGRAEVGLDRGYAAGFNDPGLVDCIEAAAQAVLGSERVQTQPNPVMGAEDFFGFGETGVPVAMFRLGVGNAEAGITAPHHSGDFDLDESALPAGVAVLAESIRRLLGE